MRNGIAWTEKLPEKTKREVRVSFFGGKLYWRDKLTPGGDWNDEMTPSEEDWERLLDEVERRYQRRKARLEDIDIVKKRLVGVKKGVSRQQEPPPSNHNA